MLLRRTVLSFMGISAFVAALPVAAYAVAPQCAAIFEKPKSAAELMRESFDARMKQTRLMAIPMKGEPGRVNFVEVVPPAPGMPLLLMLPGMNRSGRVSDPSSMSLIAAGYGVAEMSFSVHPFSVGMLPKGTNPYFQKRQPKLQDFADETTSVAGVLRDEYHTKNVVPVSLSFSGAVTPLLEGFPLIIETVPMTSERAVNAEGAAFRDKLKRAEIFNPIFGPRLSYLTMDQAYRAKWATQVDSMISSFHLPKERRQDMIEGYTALSHAAENVSWKDKKLSDKTRRVFLLAFGESEALLLDQLQTVKRLMNEGKDVSMVMIGDSGHVIPVDQPQMYSTVVQMVSNSHAPNVTGITVIIPPKDERQLNVQQFTPGDQANNWLDHMIQMLEDKLSPKKELKK